MKKEMKKMAEISSKCRLFEKNKLTCSCTQRRRQNRDDQNIHTIGKNETNNSTKIGKNDTDR